MLEKNYPAWGRGLRNGMLATALVVCLDYSRTPILAVMSMGFFLFPALLFFAVTGKLRRAATISSALAITVYLLERMKAHYYKEPITVSDLYLISDLSNWETLLHYPLAGLAVAVLSLILGASLLSHRMEKTRNVRERAGSFAIALIVALGMISCRNNLYASNAWTTSLPKGQGPFANLLFSSRAFDYTPPQVVGNDTLFLGKAADASRHKREAPSQHPDIIVWLQESTVNPNIYDLPDARLPELAMFQQNPNTRAQGMLRVHTFGGSTWLSEFAFFSGLSSRDFAGAADSVYYTVTPHLRTSLAKVLKANGYHTVILTPTNKSAYHASSAYRDFGIDEVLQPQDLGFPADKAISLWTMESSELAEYAKKILNRKTDKPIFLFMLTLKEHGPYSANAELFYGLPNTTLGRRISDYVNRIEKLSSATEGFSAFLMQRKKPALFLYFGDHQPNFENGKSTYKTQIPNAERLTQFVLRENFNVGKVNTPVFAVTDIAFLGGLILEHAGLTPDLLFKANMAMRQLCQGGLQDCPDQKLVESYRHFIYHTLTTAG